MYTFFASHKPILITKKSNPYQAAEIEILNPIKFQFNKFRPNEFQIEAISSDERIKIELVLKELTNEDVQKLSAMIQSI